MAALEIRTSICLGMLVVLAVPGCLGPSISSGGRQLASCDSTGACDRGNETDITFSPGLPGQLGTVVVEYNNVGISFGWSWSADAATWTPCHAGRVGCGGPGATVPMAPRQVGWSGDPAIVADPSQPQVVVATNLANSTENPHQGAELVVAALSFDGGRTFINTEDVTDGACAMGIQDQQAVVFDPTTTPATFWVAWRHNGAAGTGTGTYGACVRGGTVNPTTQTIDWLDEGAHEVENLDRAPFWGVGGLQVQAGDGVLTVAYSNTDHGFFHCEPDQQVRWFSVTSMNNGIDWTKSHEIYDSQDFDWCVFNDQHINSLRAFSFVRDLGGAYWAAIHDSRESIRVFFSDDLGTTWRQVVRFAGGGDRLFPSLAADAFGRIGLSFYMADVSGNNHARFFAGGLGATSPEAWLGTIRISPFAAHPPGSPGGTSFQNTTLSRQLGDYDGMTAIDPLGFPADGGAATFAPAWTSLEAGAALPTIAVAYMTVSAFP